MRALALSSLLLLGCGPAVLGVSVELVTKSCSTDPNRDPGKNVTQLRFHISGDGLPVSPPVLAPYGDIQSLLKASPYLTALYTTMSPEQMTQDPTFLFNDSLPKVSNVHAAKGVRLCALVPSPTPMPSPSAGRGGLIGPGGGIVAQGGGNLVAQGGFYSAQDAPVAITLADGRKFMTTSQGYDNKGQVKLDARTAAVPAALRIEQLKPVGGASLIKDNAGPGSFPSGPLPNSTGTKGKMPVAQVGTQGFGCAGCAATNAPPKAADTGEGMAYALVVLGFLGYRRRLRRRSK